MALTTAAARLTQPHGAERKQRRGGGYDVVRDTGARASSRNCSCRRHDDGFLPVRSGSAPRPDAKNSRGARRDAAERVGPLETMSTDAGEDAGFSYENFLACVHQIADISVDIHDGWQLQEKKGLDNGHYLTKRISQVLEKATDEERRLIVVFEYHIAYNINYGVPVLCFVAWKQDGSLLQMEEYCEYNKNFADSDVLSTLTQLDHPVLCRPFLTLHPCRTREIMDVFLSKSKNPVVSWLSVISPFLNLELDKEYVKAC